MNDLKIFFFQYRFKPKVERSLNKSYFGAIAPKLSCKKAFSVPAGTEESPEDDIIVSLFYSLVGSLFYSLAVPFKHCPVCDVKFLGFNITYKFCRFQKINFIGGLYISGNVTANNNFPSFKTGLDRCSLSNY